MSYYGSTQASSIANPPRQIISALTVNPVPVGATATLTTQGSTQNFSNAPGAGGGGLWYYSSTNLTTDLTASGNQPFFTDGWQLGMKPGDLVMGTQLSGSMGSSVVTFQAAVTQVTTSGASLSTGTCITSTFN